MNLRYVEIHGFKSFPDKTKITFDKGMTVIVGPNGSGKSNISDAVRWVLGEQSTKSLRSGKMEDVIFGGTKQRRPMGYAQVSLGLDNSDGRIAGYGDELVVTRRYYRSGDSEYLINGAQVRLRDVRETFLDTGLSRDGYSIIGQGKIAEIVSAKSTDRREIFEEASGIAKYRFRKNEAEKNLMLAEDNLSRLRDILDELTGRLEPLREQSETATEFLKLSEQRKSLEVTLYCDTIERNRRGLRDQDDKISIANRDYSDVELRITEADAAVENKFEQMREIAAKSDTVNGEIVAATERISQAEQAAAVMRNDIRHTEDQIATLREELESGGGEGGIDARIAELLQKQAEAEADAEKVLVEIDETQQLLSGLALQGEESDKRREENARQLSELTAQAADLRSREVTAAASAAASLERSQMLSARQPELAERIAEAEKTVRDFTDELNSINEQITSAENQKSGVSKILILRRSKLDTLTEDYNKKNANLDQTNHRITVLSDMEKSMDGYSQSVKQVIEAGRRGELRGVIGPVSSILSINAGCEVAIETALGAATQNIVVTDQNVAKDAIRYLQQGKVGRATFLPLDTTQPSRFDRSELRGAYGVVGVASDLVTYDRRYDVIISNLLGRIVIAEDINAASVIARNLRYRNKVVTLDGQVINAGGSFTGGFAAKNAGVFTRQNEIGRLKEISRQLHIEVLKQKAAIDDAKREVSELDARVTVCDSEIINLSGDRIRVETELRRIGAELDSARAEAESSRARSEQAGRERMQREAEAEEARTKLGEIEKRIADLENFGTSENENAEEYHQKRLELAERLAEQKIRRAGLQRDAEGFARMITELRGRVEDEKLRNRDMADQIEELEKQLESGREAAQRKEAEAEALRAEIEQMRASIGDASARRMQVEKEANELREKQNELTRQREELGKEITRLEERKVTLQKEYDSAIAKLWEDYELTRNEAQEYCIEYDSVTALRQSVSQIRSKIRALGNVNVSAIDEYKEVSERHGFLSAQVGDVEKSKEELTELINGLMGEMKTIFTEKFQQINERFSAIFTEMFGGGSAHLSLTDESDVLESGIEIDVQPPGKVINNMSLLSGGEQSLTAIALYFAILAVNPSPFCILDEIDSALDEVNDVRFAQYVRANAEETQYIAITHRRGTMEASDVLYGVTMQEEGVSRVLKLDHDEAVQVTSEWSNS